MSHAYAPIRVTGPRKTRSLESLEDARYHRQALRAIHQKNDVYPVNITPSYRADTPQDRPVLESGSASWMENSALQLKNRVYDMQSTTFVLGSAHTIKSVMGAMVSRLKNSPNLQDRIAEAGKYVLPDDRLSCKVHPAGRVLFFCECQQRVSATVPTVHNFREGCTCLHVTSDEVDDEVLPPYGKHYTRVYAFVPHVNHADHVCRAIPGLDPTASQFTRHLSVFSECFRWLHQLVDGNVFLLREVLGGPFTGYFQAVVMVGVRFCINDSVRVLHGDMFPYRLDDATIDYRVTVRQEYWEFVRKLRDQSMQRKWMNTMVNHSKQGRVIDNVPYVNEPAKREEEPVVEEDAVVEPELTDYDRLMIRLMGTAYLSAMPKPVKLPEVPAPVKQKKLTKREKVRAAEDSQVTVVRNVDINPIANLLAMCDPEPQAAMCAAIYYGTLQNHQQGSVERKLSIVIAPRKVQEVIDYVLRVYEAVRPILPDNASHRVYVKTIAESCASSGYNIPWYNDHEVGNVKGQWINIDKGANTLSNQLYAGDVTRFKAATPVCFFVLRVARLMGHVDIEQAISKWAARKGKSSNKNGAGRVSVSNFS